MLQYVGDKCGLSVGKAGTNANCSASLCICVGSCLEIHQSRTQPGAGFVAPTKNTSAMLGQRREPRNR